MNDRIKEEINKYIKFISSLDGVLQIYMFGSYANGKTHETSDIDLMVIIKNNFDPFKIAYKIRRGMAETDLTLDIAVNRISAFEEASVNSSFQKSVKENGVILYAS